MNQEQRNHMYYELGFKLGWKPLDSQQYHSREDDDFGSYLVTPGTPNYLNFYVPSSDSWLRDVLIAYARSAQAFVADVWTQLALRKTLDTKPLYLFWDQDVPKPNPATALFWLLQCESWPMPRVNDIRNADDFTPILSQLFPPQPFLLPSMQGLHQVTHKEQGHARPARTGLYETQLTAIMPDVATRFDRDQTTRLVERSLFWLPEGAVTLADFILDGSVMTRNRYSRGFLLSRASRDIAGLAQSEIQESWFHSQALVVLRHSIMNDTSHLTGLPTCHDAIYASVSAPTMKCFAESCFHIKVPLSEIDTQWTVENDRIKLYNEDGAAQIPSIIPRIWFGFTGTGPLSRNNEEYRAATAWCEAYEANRNHALTALFQPHVFNWERVLTERLLIRSDRLKKAGRIKSKTESRKVELNSLAKTLFSSNPFKKDN